MRTHLARLLRKIGWLDFDFVTIKRRDFPDPGALKAGEMVVVVDANIRKWACLRCPGGCGAPISLSLNPQRRPRWTVITDFWCRPTVSPSVHQLNACGCHFWIKAGLIEWCPAGRPEPAARLS